MFKNKRRILILGMLIAMFFTIVPATVSASSISAAIGNVKTINVTMTGTKAQVSWSKVKSASGYVVEVSTTPDFKKSSTMSYKVKGTKKTVKNLKKSKEYFYRVKAYKVAKGKTVYGAWKYKKTKLATPKMYIAAKSASKVKVYFNKVKYATSYEIYRKKGTAKFVKIKTIKKGSGGTANGKHWDIVFTDNNLKSNGSYKYKVVAKGNSKKFTKSNNAKSTNFSVSKYNYEVYYLQKPDKIFTDTVFPIYIKTNNPMKEDSLIDVRINGWGFIDYPYYSDIKGKGYDNYYCGMEIVDGGYIYNVWLDENTGKTGKKVVKIYEYKNGTENYKEVYSFTINALDYSKAEDAYIDSLIEKYTTKSMTNFEKVEALADAMRYKEFKYYQLENDYLVCLSTEAMNPYWISKRIDSCVAPYVLCKAANKIGGFDDVHNCFGDYPMGSEGWDLYHSCCRVTKGNRTEYYSGCPFAGEDEPYEMFDLKDTSKLYKVK